MSTSLIVSCYTRLSLDTVCIGYWHLDIHSDIYKYIKEELCVYVWVFVRLNKIGRVKQVGRE